MAEEPKTADQIEAEAMRAAAEDLLKLVQSTGWKVLMQQLAADAEHAQNDFIDLDAADTAAIEACQRRIKRFLWFAETPKELMAQGFEIENLPREDEEYEDE